MIRENILSVNAVLKIGKLFVGVLLFVTVFLSSVAIRDFLYERYIQTNAKRIQLGMSEAEVIAILGKPTSKAMSDSPGLYWCYGSSSWTEEGDSYCGSISLHMSDDGHVLQTP